MSEDGRTLNNPLGTAPLIPLIARYAIPSIISMLVGAAYNITDQIFIGHIVGMLGNAATNVVFPTVTLTTDFGPAAKDVTHNAAETITNVRMTDNILFMTYLLMKARTSIGQDIVHANGLSDC